LLIEKFNLFKKIKNFSISNCVYGTCAGAILMSEKCDDSKIKTLKLINIMSFRNFYGRQINSFTKNININFLKNKISVSFIRAPKLNCLSNDLDVLGKVDNNPVLIKKNNILVSSFHPELTSNTEIHKYFINMVKENV
jgi:5'-phosphate synthase pdxT subunit